MPTQVSRKHARPTRRQTGLSIIDIMVGLLIGMLTILAILQFFVFWEGQKRTTTGGASAQTTGTHALFSIEQVLRNAGFGMSIKEMLGCDITRYYEGNPLPALKLIPVEIINGADGAADTIHIIYGKTDGFTLPSQMSADRPPEMAEYCVYSNLGFAEGDFVIAWDPTDPAKACAMSQVTGVPNPGQGQQAQGNCRYTVQRSSQNQNPWNPPAGANLPDDGYPQGAYLFNFGQFVERTYSVEADYRLKEQASTFNSPALATEYLFPNIVTLQAQYGKDTDNNGTVDAWDNDTPVDSAGWQQVQAVRMVLVARSEQEEKEDVTPDDYVSKNSPAWVEEAGLVNLSLNPDGSANANWKKFRYKIFATVVPLRNTIWRQSLPPTP